MSKGSGGGGASRGGGGTKLINKLSAGGESRPEFIKGLFGTGKHGGDGAIGVNRDGIRIVFARMRNSSPTLGKVNVNTGKLIDTDKYGAENTADAQRVLDAYARQ